MKIEKWKVTDITPYDRNPRVNDAAVEAVARSIQEFGFRQPVVVDSAGVIVCGHTRYKAALMLGLTTVPVHVATDLTPAQIRAYRLADNKTSELSTWDLDLLPEELAELEALGVDPTLLGFSDDELAQLFGEKVQDGLSDPDFIPEPPDQAVTQPGDLWLLGEHRLLCGDAGKGEDVDRLLHGMRMQLVHTDPPYNVRLEPRSNNAIAAGMSSFPESAAVKSSEARGTHHRRFDLARHKSKSRATHRKLRPKDRPLANDYLRDSEFAQRLLGWFGHAARVLEPGRAFYIWGGYANLGNYPPALEACGLYFSQGIVWDKQHPVLTRKDFMGSFEIAFYGWKEGAAHQFFGPNNAVDLWHVKKVNPQSMIHLTQKPVELALRALQYSSRKGEHVLDLFGGSGSTLIAAEQTRRRAYLMEIDPLYCDVIVERWQRFTGGKAKRAGVSGRKRQPTAV